MPSDDRTLNPCQSCGARVAELRRGRCWGCYMRWTDARPVGVGASCCICSELRRDNLRSLELYGRWTPICHNCASKTARLEPVPPSIDALRVKLERDRRTRLRRVGKADSRVFLRERRREDRRTGVATPVTTERRDGQRGVPELEGLLDGLEGVSFAAETGDQTVIRELPTGLDAVRAFPRSDPDRTNPAVQGVYDPSPGEAVRASPAFEHELNLDDIEVV